MHDLFFFFLISFPEYKKASVYQHGDPRILMTVACEIKRIQMIGSDFTASFFACFIHEYRMILGEILRANDFPLH